MRFCLLVLLLFPLAVSAAVYRSVDAQGNVTFTDQPAPGAEKMKLPEPSSYSPPARPGAAATGAQGDGETGGYALDILQPQPGAQIRADGGSVVVELTISPDPGAAGHLLMVRVDDQPAEPLSSSRFVLTDLARGEHRLTVWVADAAGQVMGEERTVSFRVLRGSGLFHPQEEPPTGEAGAEQAPRAPMAPRAPRQEVPPPIPPAQ